MKKIFNRRKEIPTDITEKNYIHSDTKEKIINYKNSIHKLKNKILTLNEEKNIIDVEYNKILKKIEEKELEIKNAEEDLINQANEIDELNRVGENQVDKIEFSTDFKEEKKYISNKKEELKNLYIDLKINKNKKDKNIEDISKNNKDIDDFITRLDKLRYPYDKDSSYNPLVDVGGRRTKNRRTKNRRNVNKRRTKNRRNVNKRRTKVRRNINKRRTKVRRNINKRKKN